MTLPADSLHTSFGGCQRTISVSVDEALECMGRCTLSRVHACIR